MTFTGAFAVGNTDRITDLANTPIFFAIIGAEVAFWLLLFGGLAVRYLGKRKRLSSILLVCVPLVDVALIVLTAIDLAGGAEPNVTHALASIYLGFTVAFGHSVIAKTDAWFAYRFAGGAKPVKHPKTGPVAVQRAWAEWKRVVIAWGIAVAGLLLMRLVSGWYVPDSWEALFGHDVMWSMIGRLTAILLIWFVAGPIYVTLFKFEPAEQPAVEPTSPSRDLSTFPRE